VLAAVALAFSLLAPAPSSADPLDLVQEFSGLGWGDYYIDFTEDPHSRHSAGRGVTGTGRQQGNLEPEDIALPESAELAAVAAGFNHALGLTRDGRVLSWGRGYRSVLGDGTSRDRYAPGPVRLADNLRFTAVAGGTFHSLAVDSEGAVWSWGFNRFGQLGDGTRTERPLPVRVELPPGVVVTAVWAGYGHSLALTSAGQVLHWGRDAPGEHSAPIRTTPAVVPLPADARIRRVQVVGAGASAVAQDGRVFLWGETRFPLPSGGFDFRRDPHDLTWLPEGERAVEVHRGKVLTQDGEVFHTVFVPRQGHHWRRVQLPEDAVVVGLHEGVDHTLAVTRDRRLLAWGDNRSRQLGRGRARAIPTPGYVEGVEGVRSASAGAGFSLVAWSRLSLPQSGLTTD
jgi:alpha-tubulin suppressor-like RCC1 family protein